LDWGQWRTGGICSRGPLSQFVFGGVVHHFLKSRRVERGVGANRLGEVITRDAVIVLDDPHNLRLDLFDGLGIFGLQRMFKENILPGLVRLQSRLLLLDLDLLFLRFGLLGGLIESLNVLQLASNLKRPMGILFLNEV
jgi:hypothetical protein